MLTFDKSRLPSRHVTEGPERAPHRSYYYAMGLAEEDIHKPFVGVCSCWNEATPCNIALMRQAQATKKGVKEAGGTREKRARLMLEATDAVAFGELIIANPDLVDRFPKKAPLNDWDMSTFYGGGATGYTDYPAYFGNFLATSKSGSEFYL